jgi:hypothetical protein
MMNPDATETAHEAEYFVQYLNNEGCLEIETNQYERAERYLYRAVEFFESLTDRGYQRKQCSCRSCRQLFCLDKDETKKSIHPQSSEGDYFLHREPIKIKDTCLGHATGDTLYLILSMNLALVHHLRALDIDNSKAQMAQFRRAFGFYQTAMGEITKTPQDPGYLQVVMGIANNLGEIHRVTGNESKWTMCMEHLLSTIMLYMYYSQHYGEIFTVPPLKGPMYEGCLNNLCSSPVLESKMAGAA